MDERDRADPIDVTGILKRAAGGDVSAQNELYPHVYAEMRSLAAAHLARERQGHTLQPTALVHEAYLRLVQVKEIDWESRGHFLAIAARVMRQVLISHARARLTSKRGGGLTRVDLDRACEFGPASDETIVALDEALSLLEKESPRAYLLVELKFFGGLSFEDAARTMKVSARTLKRDWKLAKLWLYRELRQENPAPME